MGILPCDMWSRSEESWRSSGLMIIASSRFYIKTQGKQRLDKHWAANSSYDLAIHAL